MKDIPKLDIFDRKNRSQIKIGEYRSPYKIEETPENESVEYDLQIESLPISQKRKDIVFSAFGVDINVYKLSGERDASLYVILSGGTEREKDYFEPILLYPNCFPKIKIHFITGTDQVKRIFTEAVRIKDDLGGYDVNIGDRIFILTDVDDFESKINEIKPLCLKENIRLIISNPCFEIWLYYAYFKQKPNFIPKKEESKSWEFKNFLNTVIKGGVSPNEDIYKISEAIENSKNNYSEENGFPDFLTTQMHLFAEELFPMLDDGLKKLEIYKYEKSLRYK